MRPQKRIVERSQAARWGQRVDVLVDGPSPSTSSCCEPGWKARPRISIRSFTSPSATLPTSAGTFIDAEIVGRHDLPICRATVLSNADAPIADP